MFNATSIIDSKLYYCNGTDINVPPKYTIGIVYFMLGFVAQIAYLLVLKTFWQDATFWNHACYRIMFFLGIPDILSLLICAEAAGIWSIYGLHPCHNMELSYFLGCFVFGTWHMSCAYVLILAFNRSCELIAPNVGRILFSGKPLFVILCLPIANFVYFTFFTKPLIYDPTKSTFLLNPNTERTKFFGPDTYAVYGFIFNNFFVIIFIFINYFTVCTFLIYHSFITKMQKVSKLYRQVTVQCTVVCCCHFVGCFLYIYMQYVEIPQIFHIIAQLAWIGNHGLPPFVYLIFNSTIKSKVSLCYHKPPNSTIVKLSSTPNGNKKPGINVL